MAAEKNRLEEDKQKKASWKKWGPYLSERQWGTVREDYSDDGNAWDYFTHDQSRSRAYRWGEDGLAGFSDDKQFLCFALALWNGKDPILKERHHDVLFPKRPCHFFAVTMVPLPISEAISNSSIKRLAPGNPIPSPPPLV